jgi:hypothetical protein
MSQCAFNGPLARHGVAVSTPGAGTTILSPTSLSVQRVTPSAACTILLPVSSPEIAGLEFWIIQASTVIGDTLTVSQNNGAGAPIANGMASQERTADYANTAGVVMTADNGLSGQVSLYVCTGSETAAGAWIQVTNYIFIHA